jgi:hypothetical protein
VFVLLSLLLPTVCCTDAPGADGSGGDAHHDEFIQFLLDAEDTGRVLPVEGSPMVHENDEQKLFLVERHSDGGILVPGRSIGDFNESPYVSVSTRRGSGSDPLGMRVEWKVGNCAVGPDAAFSVALLDGLPLGACWSPHCYTDLPAPAEGKGAKQIEIVLLTAGASGQWTKTPFGRKIPLIWAAASQDIRDTHRQQACLPEPAASKHGELYVTDVVYSLVHRQLILFGPTRKPLGGLYCVWDG